MERSGAILHARALESCSESSSGMDGSLERSGMTDVQPIGRSWNAVEPISAKGFDDQDVV